MRKIIVSEFYSVDGMIADAKQQLDWVTNNPSEGMGEYVNNAYAGADTLFLGATTYKLMAAYWPLAQTNPDAFEGDAEFAPVMNNIRKIVFAKAPLKPTWANSEFWPSIDAKKIAHLKSEAGKNILIVGSGTIVQQLTNLGLIDEYHLLVHPVVLGSGKPLFADVTKRQPLKLLEAKTYDKGVVLLRYATTSA